MQACVLALALVWAGPSAEIAEEPQLVVLPLEPDGVKPQLGIDAWKYVVDEVAKARSKLKVSLRVQSESHEMLLGPAREQAKDCGSNVKCLREIGNALEARVIIAGKVTKDVVSLMAIDVLTGQRIGIGRSPSNMASEPIEKKARIAANILIATYSGVRPKKTADRAERADKKAQAEKKPPPEKGTEAKAEAKAEPPGRKDKSPKVEPEVAAKTSTKSATLPVPKVEPTPSTAAKTSTRSAPAEAVTRTDLVTPAPPKAEEEPVTSKWWFWTGIGAAVVAGSAIVLVLAGGIKGGPTVPSDSGSIQGTY